jgi:hypothetical protein
MSEKPKPEKKVGIESWLPHTDGRPDLFESDEDIQFYHFPCGECKHRRDSADYCKRCMYYVN